MNDSTSMPLTPIRLLFELERADNPRLYDELMRFKKGSKRVNRLRTLAYGGFIAEFVPVGSAAHVHEATAEIARHDREDSRITTHMFDEPVTEDDVSTQT